MKEMEQKNCKSVLIDFGFIKVPILKNVIDNEVIKAEIESENVEKQERDREKELN